MATTNSHKIMYFNKSHPFKKLDSPMKAASVQCGAVIARNGPKSRTLTSVNSSGKDSSIRGRSRSCTHTCSRSRSRSRWRTRATIIIIVISISISMTTQIIQSVLLFPIPTNSTALLSQLDEDVSTNTSATISNKQQQIQVQVGQHGHRAHPSYQHGASAHLPPIGNNGEPGRAEHQLEPPSSFGEEEVDGLWYGHNIGRDNMLKRRWNFIIRDSRHSNDLRGAPPLRINLNLAPNNLNHIDLGAHQWSPAPPIEMNNSDDDGDGDGEYNDYDDDYDDHTERTQFVGVGSPSPADTYTNNNKIDAANLHHYHLSSHYLGKLNNNLSGWSQVSPKTKAAQEEHLAQQQLSSLQLALLQMATSKLANNYMAPRKHQRKHDLAEIGQLAKHKRYLRDTNRNATSAMSAVDPNNATVLVSGDGKKYPSDPKCIQTTPVPPPEWIVLFSLICYIVVAVVGLFVNTLVLVMILGYTKMQTVTNMYLLNLALADELFLLGLPFFMIPTAINHHWPWGNLMCKIHFSTTSVNQFTSSFLLIVTSVDRYMAVCHPISSQRFRTPLIAKLVCLTAWAISALLIYPIFLHSRVGNYFGDGTIYSLTNGSHWLITNDTIYDITNRKFEGLVGATEWTIPGGDILKIIPDLYSLDNWTPSKSCNIYWSEYDTETDDMMYILYSCFVGFFIPLCLIMLFYLKILVKLRGIGPKNTQRSTGKKKSTRKVTQLVFAVIAVYTLCWLPHHIGQLYLLSLERCASTPPGMVVYQLLSSCLSYSNSAINPILYALMSDNFKKCLSETVDMMLNRRTRHQQHNEQHRQHHRQHHQLHRDNHLDICDRNQQQQHQLKEQQQQQQQRGHSDTICTSTDRRLYDVRFVDV